VTVAVNSLSTEEEINRFFIVALAATESIRPAILADPSVAAPLVCEQILEVQKLLLHFHKQVQLYRQLMMANCSR